MDQARAYLIDSSIYIFRSWFSLPDQWHTEEGWPLNAVYGYTRFLLEFLDAQRPRYCAAAFDESLGSCFRNEFYPEYKVSRELPDEALAFQLQTCREVTEILGIPSYGGERYEADDYLASLARLYQEKGMPVCIVTRDKDLGQILKGPEDHWWDYAGGITLDSAGFAEKHGVRPEQFADYLALVGDPIDDIPGVPGVGPKTASLLLQEFKDLGGLQAGLSRVSALKLRGAKTLGAKLEEHWPTIELARTLTGLEWAVPGVDDAPRFELFAPRLADLSDYLSRINLQGPLTRRCSLLARSMES